MKSSFLAAVMTLCAMSAQADTQPLATISDPAGDDFGAGTLIYPQRPDFQAGDLDILQMQIRRDKEGFWFEAAFKNPIHNPRDVFNTVGADSLADFARKGFYQFNIDVYIDTDRIRGSGNTFTLPGRHVSIDPDYAWEKAVILTPRPELMHQQLLSAAAEQFPGRKDIQATIDRAIFFPTRIQVRGKSIAFFVPASFFSGSDGADWAVTSLVTGASATIPADLTLLQTTKPPLERIQLGVMQPAEGHPRNTFGYSGVQPSPVVDLLGGSAEQQSRELAAMNALTGVAWGGHATAASTGAATPVDAIDGLFRQEAAAVQAASSAAEAAPLSDRSIAKRLQTLQQLYDQKLIDEAEYKRQKQRILDEL